MKHVDVIEGEVLPPERPRGAPVVFSPSPFKPGTTKHITLPYGVTVLEAVRACGVGPNLMRAIAVYIGDQRVDRSVWHVVRPKPGVPLYVRVELQGGGNGGKNPLRAILMLAVIAIAAYAAPALAASMTANVIGATGVTALSTAKLIYTAAHVLAYAGIAAAGAALVNAVAPPPKPPAQQYGFDQQPGNPYAALTGLRNQLAPFAMIPRVFGKRRMFPMLAARPYTESQGNTQYLRMLLLVGYGPIKISDIRIGNTPITAIANAQVEVREGWGTDTPVTLFTRSISEQSLSSLLSPSTPITQTTATNTTEISVDITFPNGLATFNSNTGARESRTVVVTVQWSSNGGATWNNAAWIDGSAAFGTNVNGQITCTDANAQTVVRSGRFSVPSAGTYQVRISRSTAAGGQYDVDTAYWTALRSIRADAPVKMPGLALIALRLQATSQLNGVPDAINCIAESYLPTYDGSTWSAPVITRNPAWAFAHALRFRGSEQITPDSRIDLAAIKAWADACDAVAPNAAEPRWRYDEVVESGAIWTVAQQIASHARARFAIVDGKYSIVRDVQQTVPVQHISPRNSRGYRGSKAFVDVPHAFRVKFPNDAKDNVEDEVIVYRDGYNADGSSGNIAATKFEQLPLPGCTSPTQAWREGRYHMATLLLRPEEHVVEMDFEHLRCTVGDLVRFSHDVVSIGLAHGRVAGRTVNVSNQVVSYDLDNPVDMVVGTTYGLRIRRSDGSSVVHVLTTTAGLVSTVTLATPVALSGAGDVGDHFQFGVSSLETAPMLVKRIDPGPDFTATLTLVDAQSGVYTADTGTIPAFSSYITNQIAADVAEPAAPTITLRSDESALLRLTDGTLIDRIIVTRAPPTSSAIPIRSWEVQMRRVGANGDWQQIGQFNTDVFGVAIDSVIATLAYDVRARTVSIGGVASAWTTVSNHTVVGKTTVPASLTGLAVTRYFDGNLVTWAASPEIDVVEYEIRAGGSNWATATFLGLAVTNGFFDARTSFGSITYRVRARDSIGLLSTESTITANPSAPVLGASQVAGIQGQGTGATASSVAAMNATDGARLAGVIEGVLVPDFSSDGVYWTTTFGGRPTAVAAPSGTFVDVAGEGRVFQCAAGTNTYLTPRAAIKIQPGRRYLYMARVRVATDPSAGSASFGFNANGLNDSWGHLDPTFTQQNAGTLQVPGTQTAANGWRNIFRLIVIPSPYTGSANYFRPRLDMLPGTGGVLQVSRFEVLDATDAVIERKLTSLMRDDGTTAVLETAVVTSLGTASAIAGQGALATANSAAWGSQVSGRPANLSVLGGSEGINNALVPIGVNGVPNSDFLYNSTWPPLGWISGGTGSAGGTKTDSIVVANGRRSLKSAHSGSPTSGTSFDLAYLDYGNYPAWYFPVTPGDTIGASLLMARNASVSNAYFSLIFYTASFVYVTEMGSNSVTASTNGDTNEPANYTLLSLVFTAPATARYCMIVPRAVVNGGASPTIWAMEPMIARLAPGQTTVPPYSPTPADRRADVTASNTASAISGQGSLATRSFVDFSSGDVTNRTANNLTYTAGGTVDSLRPGEAGANVTETRNAAGIAGQGPWATTGTALSTVLAPAPNLFPYPSPIYNIYGGSSPAPSTYGWAGTTAPDAGYWQPAGGPIYIKQYPSGGAARTDIYYFDIPNAVVGVTYTVSLTGYASNATQFSPYVEFLNSARSTVLASAVMSVDGPSGRYVATLTAPTSAAWLRVVVRGIFPASGSYQDIVWSRIKVEQGSVMTPFNSAPEVTPRQAGADVTGSNISSGFSGQGSMSTQNANNVAITGGSVNIGSGKFVVDTGGNVTITNSLTGARLEVTSSVLRVYDSSNVLRVRMGIW